MPDTKIEVVAAQTFSTRHVFFQAIIVINIIAFAALTLLAKTHPYFSFDLSITQIIQTINLPWFDELMRLITELGNYPWAPISIGVVSLIFVGINHKRSALATIISSLGVFLISLVFKTIVGRPRPSADLIQQIGGAINSPSFPSGHVLFYIGLYGFLLYLVDTRLKNPTLRLVLIITLTTLLILVGISRIYLGAHWFSDVLGSYLIGFVWLYVMSFIYRRLVKSSS